ncbi:MAG: hypothetical protein AB8I08_27465 [Sandaracinaceae bacterium]
MIELKVSPVKPLVLAVVMLALGAGAWVMLPGVYFLPGFFVLCATLMAVLSGRLASGPILTADEQEVRFGIWRQRRIPRGEVAGANYDGRTLSFRRRDGSTENFTPALYGRDLATIAKRVSGWAR